MQYERFQCPFPVDKQVSKLTFANALLLGLAHDPVIYFYFDELLRSDAVDNILNYSRRTWCDSPPVPNPSLMDVFSSPGESAESLESQASRAETAFREGCVELNAYSAGLGTSNPFEYTHSTPFKPKRGILRESTSRSYKYATSFLIYQKFTSSMISRPRLLSKTKDMFLQVWNSPLRSSPSRESLKAMEHGIDLTAVLRAVKLFSKREHPHRSSESIEDFVWLLLNGLAGEIFDLERQLDMVEERELSFRDCTMGKSVLFIICILKM